MRSSSGKLPSPKIRPLVLPSYSHTPTRTSVLFSLDLLLSFSLYTGTPSPSNIRKLA
jgi:hypothetical protein